MKSVLKSIYKSLPQGLQASLKSVKDQHYPPPSEPLMYRIGLFEELDSLSKKDQFENKRILEIGPKDGLDSLRLSSLKPSELVMIDLPEKRDGNDKWLDKIEVPHQYIEANFMYMSHEEIEKLGKFDLVWCTGVLYHNAEQMRLLRKLYKLLNADGMLVMESATLRNQSMQDKAYVEVYYPETFRNTGTVTHLPNALAIKAWLQMAGFDEIFDSNCYENYGRDLMDHRYACICKKHESEGGGEYYHKSNLNPAYLLGDSV